jgi:SulP family sulfate permease
VDRLRSIIKRDTLKSDAVAGITLGVESVPDGLAGGLLAGVNPVWGLYGYMVGTFAGGLSTSSAFMAVQATGAMAIVVADVPAVHSGEDPDRALWTLAVLTGVVMLAAGLFKLGFLLRFVSNAVMVGFINAVGVNIILGQFENFTGYASDGSGRVLRAIDTIFSPFQLSWPTVFVGVVTIVLIIVLEKTRLKALGMVAAIILGSALAFALNWFDAVDIELLNGITDVPRSLPRPQLPWLGVVPQLIVPALSLAFVGLVQGAGISANFPNPDGSYPDASRDFSGQGIANMAAGIFQGMPVGGSMSASSLNKAAGAKSRLSLVIAGVVMAVVILLFAGLVGYIAMPALAGLLMIVGYRTIKPDDIEAVWKTGSMQQAVMGVTFVLTLAIPLQWAVMVGVGISLILVVITQSNRIRIRRRVMPEPGVFIEEDPPETVPPNEVVILQPYGSLFFASAGVFEDELPEVTQASTNSVVILRLRGRSDLGSTFMDVLARYAEDLSAVGSKLVLVSADEQLIEQLDVTGVTAAVGEDNIYPTDERVGATMAKAAEEATDWIAGDQSGEI